MIKAACPHCGLVFTSVLSIPNTHGLTLQGNRETCPNCGKMANTSEGVFSTSSDRVEIHSAPGWTRKMYGQLASVARKAKEDDLSAMEILKEVAEVSPELADTLRKRGFTATVIVLLLIWLLKNISLDVTIDVNRLIDQGVAAVGGSVAPVAAPPTPPATQIIVVPQPAPTDHDRQLPPSSRVALLPAPLSLRARRRQRGRTKSQRR